MDNNHWIEKDIIASIKEDILNCQELLSLLTQEKNLFESRDIDALEKNSENKLKIYHLLETSHAKRNIALAQNNLPADKASLHAVASQLEHNHKISFLELEKKLIQLLEEIQTKNEVNGTIAAVSHFQMSRVLDVMYNRDTSELYSDEAQTYSISTSQTITKA